MINVLLKFHYALQFLALKHQSLFSFYHFHLQNFLLLFLFSSRAFSNTSISKLISFIFLEEFIILFSTLFIFSLFSLIEVDASVVAGVNPNPLNVNVNTVPVTISVFFKNNSPFLIFFIYYFYILSFFLTH